MSQLRHNRIASISSPLLASFALSGLYVVQNGFQTLWELIYPRVCVHCHRVGSTFCRYCQQDIKPADNTLPSPQLTDYVAVGCHADALRTAIHALKYEYEERLKSILGTLLAAKILERKWASLIDIIVPIPLHARRLKERGYNQAESIAQAVQPHIDRPVVPDALLRTRNTLSQVGMQNPEQRYANVQGAFVGNHNLVGLSILLIDDVCTTGATLEAGAVALRAAGATTVLAATISRA